MRKLKNNIKQLYARAWLCVKCWLGFGPKQWIGGPGEWHDPTHWKPFGVPAGDMDVLICVPRKTKVTIAVPREASCRDVTIIGGGMFEWKGPPQQLVVRNCNIGVVL